MVKAIGVKPGSRVNLSKIESRQNGGLTKEEGQIRLQELTSELNELQDLLYAAGECSLLVILQGMDTSGKDGTIKSVFRAIDPLGASTFAFKVPSEEELDHDFLWRVHKHVPRHGMITIFNRSHYEDVIAVRVKNLAPVDVWRKRYDHINAFERQLTDQKTIVLKFFLHISKDEQEERLLAREEDPAKAWKLAAGDWKDRGLWGDFQKAYEDALSKCSTPNAPWYIVPADRKWYRDVVVAETLVETLKPWTKEWNTTLEALGKVRKAEIDAFRGAS